MALQREDLWVREIFGAHYKALLRFLIVRIHRREDAEDLAQETFLRLLRVPRADLILRPDAYLFRIAANLLTEFRLRSSRSIISYDSERMESLVNDPAPPGPGSVPPAELLLDSRSLARVVAKLPPRCRVALILHRRDGLTYAQIGEQLGVSPDMIKKYLAQAVSRCRVALGEKS